MDRAEVEKKVAEKLRFSIVQDGGEQPEIRYEMSGEKFEVPWGVIRLWNYAIDSELRRAEARELLRRISTCDRSENMKHVAAYLKEEENRG